MTTPAGPFGPREDAGQTPGDAAARPAADPDNPPWGVLGGAGLWVASVLLLYAFGLAFVIPYLLRRGVGAQEWEGAVMSDPTAVFLMVVSAVPAHLFTLGVAWLIVTRAGRRPFFRGLGWEWGAGLSLWRSAALAVGLLALSVGIIYLTGSPETQLDRMLKSSRAAALATAFLATFTAPLVEEVVYRGALYSGLRKYLGAAWAGLFVVVLFAVVHVPQYWPSVGIIVAILLLSAALTFVRARTGQLLPCVVIHTVFNGIQSALIVAEPYLKRLAPETPPVPPPDPALLLWLARLFG